MNSAADVSIFQQSRDWELMWAPYDLPTYKLVLDEISVDDVVLEIGAGDLRLSRLIANKAAHVYGIEIQTGLLERQVESLPHNLSLLPGDALVIPYPSNISAAVLLMRHCTHFFNYVERLKKMGCARLITNARWRCAVEVVDLQTERMPYSQAEMGWYACWCGAAGFKAGLPERYTPEMDDRVNEVINCPECVGYKTH